MRTLHCVLAAITVVSVAGCGGGGEVRPVPPAFQDGFSGTWVRNASLSQDPEQTAGRGGGAGNSGDAFGRGRGSGGGRGAGGSRGGRRGGGGGAGGGDIDPADMQRIMRAMRPAQRAILALTDSTVELTTGRGAPLLLGLDGEETEIELGGDETMKARAEWKGETLEIRTNLGGGLSITRTYSLDQETGRMEIDVSSNVRGRRIRRVQVYDRARQ